MNKFTEQAEDAIKLYYSAIAKKVEQMPEFNEFCHDEMEKVLTCYPVEVREHVEKMKNLTAFEYMKWAPKS